METIRQINGIIAILFLVLYAYQFLYIPALWILHDRKMPGAHPRHGKLRYAALICARNESKVISGIIGSINSQTIPGVTVFVMADNCTDNTADIAKKCGAVVYTRKSATEIGKGYALTALLGHIREDYPDGFDGYFVFDADNILAPDYIENMDKTFRRGHDIITSFRNSTNFGANWISAGYALWFLHESRYLNHARYCLGQSCAVGGTGFMFSREVFDEMGTWPYHTLTEDIEFTVSNITRGRKIAFCPNAELFDEQPVTFQQSWRQRLRWAKGYYQVFGIYGKDLIRGIFRGSFSCYDMAAANMPAFIAATAAIILNAAALVISVFNGTFAAELLLLIKGFASSYLMLLALGGLSTVTEWRRIKTSAAKKILYTFTFPVFMMTYLPISFAALFSKPEWKPIIHYGSPEHKNAPRAA